MTQKRAVVNVSFYIYADDEKKLIKQAKNVLKKIDKIKNIFDADIEEVNVLNFGSINPKKIM